MPWECHTPELCPRTGGNYAGQTHSVREIPSTPVFQGSRRWRGCWPGHQNPGLAWRAKRRLRADECEVLSQCVT